MTEQRPVDPTFHVPARRVIGLAAGVAIVLWLARPVIIPFVLAAFIAYAFTPFIDAAQARTGRSRFVIVVTGYGTGLIVVGLIVLAFAGPIYRELQMLVQAGPNALETALRQILGQDSVTIGDRTITVEEMARQLQAALSAFLQTPEGALRIFEQFSHVLLDIVLTIIVTFYLLLDGVRFSKTAMRFLDPADRVQLERVFGRIHVVLGHWLRGQLVLVLLIAVIVSIVLGPILHVPFATGLGAMTGLLEVIPLIGPLVAGTIVAMVALSSGGIGLAITVVVFLFVLRQIEDAVVMPLVVGRSVHLHPLVALFAVVVGTTAFGVLGTLLAVPVAASINVALHEFFPAELGALPGDPPPTPSPAAEPATADDQAQAATEAATDAPAEAASDAPAAEFGARRSPRLTAGAPTPASPVGVARATLRGVPCQPVRRGRRTGPVRPERRLERSWPRPAGCARAGWTRSPRRSRIPAPSWIPGWVITVRPCWLSRMAPSFPASPSARPSRAVATSSSTPARRATRRSARTRPTPASSWS